MPVRDTTARAQAIQTAIFRSLRPAERFRSAIEMSDFTHKLAEAGLRQRRPECDEDQIPRLLAEILYLHRERLR